MDETPLPPPRWKVRGGSGGCGRTFMLVAIGFIGLNAACCCMWAGTIHATVDDAVRREGGWDRLGEQPDTPSWVREDLERVRRSTPTSEDGPPRRTGLLPEEDIPPQEGLSPPSRELPSLSPDAQPPEKARAGPDEGELFGF